MAHLDGALQDRGRKPWVRLGREPEAEVGVQIQPSSFQSDRAQTHTHSVTHKTLWLQGTQNIFHILVSYNYILSRQRGTMKCKGLHVTHEFTIFCSLGMKEAAR